MKQSPGQIFLRFLRFGCLAWGGPVAQISMIRQELVHDEQWVSKEEFNRALAVYQALPGPEAHELCVYFGMKAGGRIGGFLAGLAFMLPGFVLMLLLTWLYMRFGLGSPMVQQLFAGIQAAVVALIIFAVYRIGKHAVINKALLIICIASGLAFFLGVNFLFILPIAGFSYVCVQKKNTIVLPLLGAGLVAITVFTVYTKGFVLNQGESNGAAVQTTSSKGSPGLVFVSGLKTGLLTFGGAYTAIPFLKDDAVEKHRWMTERQFLDGIALSGILPAPLIIFSTFVGYFGGGWLGAILITIGVFLPAFCFTLVGHRIMEKLIARTGLHSF